VAVGSNGTVFLAGYYRFGIYSYNGSSLNNITYIDQGTGDYFKGVSIRPDGTIFLANGDYHLHAYSFDGNSLTYTARTYGEGKPQDLAIGADGKIFLASKNAGLIVYDYAEYVGFEIEKLPVVSTHELYQNYPNPFNSLTRINYSLFDPAFVSLKIYDVLGKKILTLVSEFQTNKENSIQFDSSKLPSGVYYYQLKVGTNFYKTKKMIILK